MFPELGLQGRSQVADLKTVSKSLIDNGAAAAKET